MAPYINGDNKTNGVANDKSNGIFPVANALTPFWRTELHELDSHRSTSELPEESDLVIIGAGYAGAATAYHYYHNNDNPGSVLILEARQACSGATGRNGGHCKADIYFSIPKYTEMYGADNAVALAQFELDHVNAIKDVVDEEKIDCDFLLTRYCDVSLDEEYGQQTKKAFDRTVKSHPDLVKDVIYTDAKYAERVSGVKNAKASFNVTGASLWPYKFVMALLQLVIAKGANLQTETPVTSISETPDAQGRWLLKTSRGSVSAKKIVFATNGYTAGVAPQYEPHIIPARGICSRIMTPEDKPAPFLPYSYSVRYGPGFYDYQCTRPDSSIIVGGARHLFLDDISQWYGVVDDSKLIEPAAKHFDGLMQERFIGWKESGAYTDRVWTGIMGYTSDLMPHAGEVPEKAGQFILAGFNGHGMPQIFLTAKGISQMIREGKPFEEVGVPTMFKTTRERLMSTKNALLDGDMKRQGFKDQAAQAMQAVTEQEVQSVIDH